MRTLFAALAGVISHRLQPGAGRRGCPQLFQPVLQNTRSRRPRSSTHLQALSSDEMEGRAPSTPGGQRAADYIAAQLKAMGVEPAGENGTYFQQVPIVESVVDRNFTLSVPGRTYRYLDDVVAFSGTEQARVHVQGDVVFVGHGIVAPEQKWNDYAGANVKRQVGADHGQRPARPAGGPGRCLPAARSRITAAGRTSSKRPPARVPPVRILIHTDESATYPWQVVQSSWSGTQYSLPPAEGVPALAVKAWMTNAAAVDLVRRGGQNLDKLRESALQSGLQAGDAQPSRGGHDAATHVAQDLAERRLASCVAPTSSRRGVHLALRSLRDARRAAGRCA